METERIQYFRKIILKERDELVESLSRVDNEMLGHMDQKPIEFNERGEEESAMTLLSRLDFRQKKELSLIEEALARIHSGSYGICTQCGTNILEDRLHALPYTSICKTCARKGTSV